MVDSKSNGSAERSAKTFKVDLLAHEDGTFTAIGENLRGRVLETESLEEMRAELLRLTPYLLRTNHDLIEDEIDNALIYISTYRMVNGKQESFWQLPQRAPHLMWEDILPTSAVA